MCFARLGLFHVWDFSPTFHFSVSVSCNGLQDTLPGGTVGGVNGCTITSPPSVSHEELVIVDNESIVIFFSLCLYHFLITYLFSLSFSLCSQLRLLLRLLLIHHLQDVTMTAPLALEIAVTAAMEVVPAVVESEKYVAARVSVLLNNQSTTHTTHPRLYKYCKHI